MSGTDEALSMIRGYSAATGQAVTSCWPSTAPSEVLQDGKYELSGEGLSLSSEVSPLPGDPGGQVPHHLHRGRRHGRRRLGWHRLLTDRLGKTVADRG